MTSIQKKRGQKSAFAKKFRVETLVIIKTSQNDQNKAKI